MDLLSMVEPADLEELGRSLGTRHFYQAALRVVSALVPGEFEAITVYSRQARPQMLHFEATSKDISEDEVARILGLYKAAYFRFDPFYRYWREVGRPGVLSVYEIPDLLQRDARFIASYMPEMRMSDDVLIFLPIPNGRAVALSRERNWRFEEMETDRLRLIYPLLAGLNESHVRAVAATGTGEPFPIDEDESSAPSPLDFVAAVDDFTASGFTPREREIVSCILAGYPNDYIAKKLAIGVGTIRNHRKRLYAKLDVTSEREVFSLFIGHLANKDASSLLE
jgi:DNA-binding CsgD family transcriptional regulator